jgi:hypothetical protein
VPYEGAAQGVRAPDRRASKVIAHQCDAIGVSIRSREKFAQREAETVGSSSPGSNEREIESGEVGVTDQREKRGRVRVRF